MMSRDKSLEQTGHLRPLAASEDDLLRLVERNRSWVSDHVRRRLGPALRGKLESQDVVQEAMLKVLKYGPRVRVTSDSSFRRLLVRVVENVIRDQNDWFAARRRAVSREKPLPQDSAILIDAPRREVDRPSQAADRHEWEELVGLGLELLPRTDRSVIRMRQWEKLTFPAIGDRLGLTESGARMRYARGLTLLANCIARLRAGQLDQVLDEEPEPDLAGESGDG